MQRLYIWCQREDREGLTSLWCASFSSDVWTTCKSSATHCRLIPCQYNLQTHTSNDPKYLPSASHRSIELLWLSLPRTDLELSSEAVVFWLITYNSPKKSFLLQKVTQTLKEILSNSNSPPAISAGLPKYRVFSVSCVSKYQDFLLSMLQRWGSRQMGSAFVVWLFHSCHSCCTGEGLRTVNHYSLTWWCKAKVIILPKLFPQTLARTPSH